MNFNIELSEEDVDTIIEVWRHAVHDSLCRKISDQIRAQIPTPLTIGDLFCFGSLDDCTFLAIDSEWSKPRMYYKRGIVVDWACVSDGETFETPDGRRKVVKL
jgi:hypothetical protein